MIDGFHGEYKFLSNFYPSDIEFEGLRYPTVEHAYQAAKTEDPEMRKFIAAKETPSQAKRIGRIQNLREDWENIKIPIMKTLLRKKFYDPVLKAALLATGENKLEETNYWHDQFWGNCWCSKHVGSNGENHLGKLLMELRTELSK